ncbi:hypothetical protein [Amycolatopsis sp. H20-H5]|uniref:hypothetical protein n=1 Tax=Amycolatopsis sp. H20-H5 TaxID=3046309 RepID=UPI002DBCF200|nr:hypothetical protein [Amycolatopsis sp. H20-H5]MEC3981242.1 hypothetical protein [Amycolatopsis sp. H20-H5]
MPVEHQPPPRRGRRPVGICTASGILALLVVIVSTALITGRFPEDNPVDNIGSLALMALICGGGLGAAVGSVLVFVRGLGGPRPPAAAPAWFEPDSSRVSVAELIERVERGDDPWRPPVASCQESVRMIERTVRVLEPSAARDWLFSIADTTHDKLSEVEALAELGRGLLPGRERGDVGAVREHEIFHRLVHSSEEFAGIEAEVLRLAVKSGSDADLDQVRVELELLGEQLDVLKPVSATGTPDERPGTCS